MSGEARAVLLADGRRLHLQHGPIDLIVEAFGDAREVALAYRQATHAFAPVLGDLVAELALLRRPIQPRQPAVAGAVARRMVAACDPHAATFITPMAAVAGAVADFVLAAMVEGRRLSRAYVNNGGDIALHLGPESQFQVGIVSRLDAPAIDAVATVTDETAVRGVATSGQGGRSLSLGIADAVTVLGGTAAGADAAATLIANAVDVDSPAIRRAPATTVVEDSDLGALPVTLSVGPLDAGEVAAALAAGSRVAQRMRSTGLISAAFLSLRGQHRLVGTPCQVLTQQGARWAV